MSVSVNMTNSKTKSLTSNSLKANKRNQKIQEEGGREFSNLLQELIPNPLGLYLPSRLAPASS